MGITKDTSKIARAMRLQVEAKFKSAALPDYGPEPAMNAARRQMKHN
jgi:hypothetical protein